MVIKESCPLTRSLNQFIYPIVLIPISTTNVLEQVIDEMSLNINRNMSYVRIGDVAHFASNVKELRLFRVILIFEPTF